MHRICLTVSCAMSVAAMASAQIEIRRTIPLVVAHRVPGTEEGCIARILEREIHGRADREDVVRELVELGRDAAPFLAARLRRAQDDPLVIEALLRIGGPHAQGWIDEKLSDPNESCRMSLLRALPPVDAVDTGVRRDLDWLLVDRSPRVRVLAVRKLDRYVPAHELIACCNDSDREVIRTAFEVVSHRWLFLDHGDQELKNLGRFVELLEMHRSDDELDVGRGFVLAFDKVRIDRAEGGRELHRRALALPWFVGVAEDPRAKAIQATRQRLLAANADREAILARALRDFDPASGAELLLVLADEPDARVRLATCDAGLRLLDPELAGSFLRFLADPDETVRAKAKEVLELTTFAADQRARWRGRSRF